MRKIEILRFFTFLIFLSFPSVAAFSQMFYAGEVIEYQVSYLGIRLGTIKIVTEAVDSIKGSPVFRCRAFIDSRPGIPFVDLHSIFNSWIDKSAQYSQQFLASTKGNEGWYYDKYNFDYKKGTILFESGFESTQNKSYLVNTNTKWNDGLSLFFLARQFCASGRNISVPTIMNSDTVRTAIYFGGKREEVSIDASSYPIKTVYFNGNANWTGIYGMTGKFEGWFSDDEAHIPIKAKLKLYVGNANIELVRWSRGNWQPPKTQ